jgi:hypothetical protein
MRSGTAAPSDDQRCTNRIGRPPHRKVFIGGVQNAQGIERAGFGPFWQATLMPGPARSDGV